MTDHTHRVIRKRHTRSNGPALPTHYPPGTEITPTEDELRAFPDRFEELPKAGSGEASSARNSGGERAEDAPADSGSDAYDPTDHTVRELGDHIAESEDPDELVALYEAEEAGDDRVTVKRRIADRLSALGHADYGPDDEGDEE